LAFCCRFLVAASERQCRDRVNVQRPQRAARGTTLTPASHWRPLDRSCGAEHRQRARAVVVCANGIGTPRLLLLSASAQHPDGLANFSGLVGKNLMLHPNGSVTGFYDENLEHRPRRHLPARRFRLGRTP